MKKGERKDNLPQCSHYRIYNAREMIGPFYYLFFMAIYCIYSMKMNNLHFYLIKKFTFSLFGQILFIDQLIKRDKVIEKNQAETPDIFHFQSRATRLYTPLCRSIGPSVLLSVGPSIRPSHFTFFGFLGFLASLLLPK